MLKFAQGWPGTLVLLMALGCSNGSDDTSPKDCLASVIRNHKMIDVPVACSPPIEIMTILGKDRFTVEQLLGPSEPSLQKHERELFYRGGGIKIIYTREGGLATKIQIYPQQLPATPEDVLAFISLENTEEVMPLIYSGLFEWHLSRARILATSFPDDPGKIKNIRADDLSE